MHDKLADCLLSSNMPDRIKNIAVGAWVGLEEKYGKGLGVAVKQLIAAVKFKDPARLKNIKVPSLIVCGKEDRFVPPSHSKKLHDCIPGSLFVEINGGHELHMDSRDDLKQAIIDHVKRNLNDA